MNTTVLFELLISNWGIQCGDLAKRKHQNPVLGYFRAVYHSCISRIDTLGPIACRLCFYNELGYWRGVDIEPNYTRLWGLLVLPVESNV